MEVEPKTMSNKVLPVYDANTRSAFEAYKVSVLEVTLFLFSADKILSIQQIKIPWQLSVDMTDFEATTISSMRHDT